MKITKQQLVLELLRIEELIDNEFVDEACEKYIMLKEYIEVDNNETEESIKADIYSSFAYFLFMVSEYEQCLNMFIKAQQHGYSKEEIERFIFSTFIEPNLNEFKSVYEQNVEYLLSKNFISEFIDFEALPFWLIPTMNEKEYYLYDKNEKIIKEKFCSQAEKNNTGVLTILDQFSDYLILEEWNWNKIYTYINGIRKKGKKSYIVINNLGKFLTCFQAELLNKVDISDISIFTGFHSMKEYFKSSSEYLPRNIIDMLNKSEQAKNIINEVHNYRINEKGRKGDNVLLSICIPSYNRGNRAYDNIIHNLQSYYDEEIEIVLSNNGTKNESKEYYDKIEQIIDSRLKYFSFNDNEGFAINLCKVCELAEGKFIFLISDEDLVNFNSLDLIMNELRHNKKSLAIIKTSCGSEKRFPSTKLAKAGRDAILTYMLSSNYMSGIIFNNNILKQYDGIKYIKENLNNSTCYYYPHMFLELLLCQYGNVQATDTILVNLGKTEKTEVINKEVGINYRQEIPYYASLEGRLEQLEGFLRIFKDLEICNENFDILRKMYIKLVDKTMFLVSVSINFFYKNTDLNVLEILEKTYECCIKKLDEVYHDMSDLYKEYYKKDLNQISDCYEYLKENLNL